MNIMPDFGMMTSRSAERAMMRKLHVRLIQLNRWSCGSGERYFWQNGVIRSQVLHPTKGWRVRRVEAFPLISGQFAVRGYVSFADAEHLSSRWR